MNVRLISRTAPVIEELEGATPEEIMIYVARVSSDREDKRENYAGLLRYMLKHSHWSPFEHISYTFEIVTSRAISRQILRHRSFQFQELSQRYQPKLQMESFQLRRKAAKNRQSSTDYLGEVLPDGNYNLPKDDHDEHMHWLLLKASTLMDSVFDVYNELIHSGVAAETARMMLPGATESTLYMTGTLRSWIHFLAVRDHADAQGEVQEIAREIKNILITECPITAEALEWTS